MSKLIVCPGTRRDTPAAGAPTTCPVCKRVQKTHPSGRLYTHFEPAKCDAIAYSRGRGGAAWPGPCSARAKEGSRFCGRHGG